MNSNFNNNLTGFNGTPKNLLNNLMKNVSSFNKIIEKKNKEKMKEPRKINKLQQSKFDKIKGKFYLIKGRRLIRIT